MIALFLWMTLAAQAGAITGALRSEQGEPLAGTRVAALSLSEEPRVTVPLGLAGVTLTDKSGRYRLENLPPGRYYVIAGSLADPTFYPGATAIADARVVTVEDGGTANADFVLTAWSICQMRESGFSRVPVRVWGKVASASGPASAAAGAVVIMNRSADGEARTATVGVDGTFQLDLPSGEYSISMLLVPLGFSLKSITSDGVDLVAARLRLGPCAPRKKAASPIEIPLEITLQPNEPRFRIDGRIFEPGRSTIDGVQVEISGESGLVGSCFLDDNYGFEFTGLVSGPYTVRWILQGRELGAKSVVVTDKDVTLEFTAETPR